MLPLRHAAVMAEDGLGPHLTQCGLGPRPTYVRTNWHLGPSSSLATTDGLKIGEMCPLF